MDLYIIEEVIFANVIKIRLPTSMRIHPVVKISVTYYQNPFDIITDNTHQNLLHSNICGNRYLSSSLHYPVQINLAPFRISHSIIKYITFPCSPWNYKHYSEDFQYIQSRYLSSWILRYSLSYRTQYLRQLDTLYFFILKIN